jgi:outer membrane protein OmpA-like peptidoglycan-associated protein
MKTLNYALLMLVVTGSIVPVQALEYATAFQVKVNSNKDEMRTDDVLTLREAIAVVNGDLPLDRLSSQEKAQVVNAVGDSQNRISFELAAGQQRIELKSALPNVTKRYVTIEGKTSRRTKFDQIVMDVPTVEITPAAGVQIDRGLALMANNITVKGLSIYGFRVGLAESTQNLPGADIFVGTSNYPGLDERPAPTNIVIENNFLGFTPNGKMPENTSDFGVYVFNSQGTTVRNNAIAYHSASGIISQVNANNLLVEGNAIFANGTQGMPDAIRLEGNLVNNRIRGNAICGNDGSAVFVFKPASGTVKITDNRISSNGRRLRRAAIHLMGNDNIVSGNQIEWQTGAGVAVSAFSQHHWGELPSARNLIQNNRFSALEGLSVDLVTYRNDAVENFQDGDGVNTQRNSENRRLDTGNGAVNAPQFLASEFYLLGGKVNIDGTAEPYSQVEIYEVYSSSDIDNGPLSRPLSTVTANAQGRFSTTLSDLKPGMILSAATTMPKYGTSEPARNAVVALPGQTTATRKVNTIPTNCNFQDVPVAVKPPVVTPVTPPPVVTPDPVTPPAVAPPAIARIEIPQKVHFALDKSTLSPATTKLLDEIVRVLEANPSIVVNLAGHTDPRAPQAYNQALGLRRATAVRNYLLRKGVASNRMTIRSMSFKQRATSESGVKPYALDRRVEFEYRDVRGVELQVIDRFDDLQPER